MRLQQVCMISFMTWGCADAPTVDHPQKETRADDEGVIDGEDGAENDDFGSQNGDSGSGDSPADTGSPTLLDDDAIILAVDIPSQLDCGGSYTASVEVQNTGLATWTRDEGYKLGTVNDEDELYGPDTRVWLPEGVSVASGETHVFEFELAAPVEANDYLTDWRMVHEDVQWFGDTTAETVSVTCDEQTVCDPLTDAAIMSGFVEKAVSGGSFSSAGWQSTDGDDQILLELTAPISGNATLEIDVTNFDPESQYSSEKHQIINMYTSDDGSQGVFDTDEAWWNIRTGTNYGTGLKLLAAPNGGDSREEVRLIESATWDVADTHTFTVTWDDTQIDLYLDGVYLETLGFDGRAQPLGYIFLGKDNVYTGQVGPIYSNFCVSYQP